MPIQLPQTQRKSNKNTTLKHPRPSHFAHRDDPVEIFRPTRTLAPTPTLPRTKKTTSTLKRPKQPWTLTSEDSPRGWRNPTQWGDVFAFPIVDMGCTRRGWRGWPSRTRPMTFRILISGGSSAQGTESAQRPWRRSFAMDEGCWSWWVLGSFG